jgi:hypothetical protein
MQVSGKFHIPTPLPRGGKAPGTHGIGVCVSPTAGLDAVVKFKVPACAGNRTPVIQPVAELLCLVNVNIIVLNVT